MRVVFSALFMAAGLTSTLLAHEEPRGYRNDKGECVVIDRDAEGNGVSSSVSAGGGSATATAGGGRSATVMSGGNGHGSSAVAGSSSYGGKSAAIASGSGDCVIEEKSHEH
jgi:hypothetical protein